MKTDRRRILSALGAGAWMAHSGARAQGFPDRPVKMIVPYPPGGGADQWARIVAARLEKLLGQPVVFDYRPGGTTTIGAEATARAPADGYTIHLISTSAFAYLPNLRKVGYDPVNAFVPIGYLGVLPMLLVANPKVPARNVPELIAYARANPGRLNCASAGVGSAHHLIAEFFKLRTGITLNHVPYKGAVQYIPDLIGGQVDLAVSTLSPAIPHLLTGKLRAIGVTSAKRASALPDVPTIGEQGVTGFDEKPWNCFVGPAGIPPEPLARLRAAMRATLEDPDTITALRNAGVEEIGALPVDRITEQMRTDLVKWGDVIRQARITIDS
ncbi:MAG: tripartite tricarboxylate transporter substrate binding protein [Burkholderiales bacterium]|nr:tripartite tricarboxylate transporter substrate binding protein [Burkholderiales bacterium]